jgi:hypothetical protein
MMQMPRIEASHLLRIGGVDANEAALANDHSQGVRRVHAYAFVLRIKAVHTRHSQAVTLFSLECMADIRAVIHTHIDFWKNFSPIEFTFGLLRPIFVAEFPGCTLLFRTVVFAMLITAFARGDVHNVLVWSQRFGMPVSFEVSVAGDRVLVPLMDFVDVTWPRNLVNGDRAIAVFMACIDKALLGSDIAILYSHISLESRARIKRVVDDPELQRYCAALQQTN